MKKIIKGKLAMLLALILVFLSCVPSLAASSYSTKWYKTADGQWQAKKYGILLKSTWILDDECDVQGGIWYLVDENGNLVTDKLVKDGNGRYYTFNDQHDGHYGTLITKDGKYYGVDLKFSQIQDASYGSIINTEGITALKKAYGVREFPNLTNASSVRLSTGTSSVRSSRKKSTPTPSPITYDKKTKYYVDYDVNGVSDVQDMPTAEWVGYGEYATKPVPATPSVVTTGTATPSQICTGWYTSTSATPDTKWDFTKDRVFNNMTLYAGWVESECTVEFVDEKNIATVSQTVPYGSKLKKVASPSQFDSIHTFLGWCKDSDGTGLWDFDNNVVTESISLFAFWGNKTESYHKVTYVSDHGEIPCSDIIQHGQLLENIVLKDSDYQFVGWYTEPEFISLWNFDIDPITEDMTLFAKWVKKQDEVKSDLIKKNSSKSTLDFKADEIVKTASMPMTAAKELIPQSVDGELVKTSEDISTELSLNLKVSDLSENSIEYDISLFCTAEVSSGGTVNRTETTKVNDAKGLVSIEVQIDKYLSNVNVNHSGEAMEEMSSADDTPIDQTVGGFYYDDSTGILTIKTQYFSPFIISYDLGIINDLGPYSVTFKWNGHGESSDTIESNIDKDTKIATPSTIIDGDYSLEGWYKERTFKNKWDFDNDKVTHDITLYAKWESGAEVLITKIGEEDQKMTLAQFRDNVNLGISYAGYLVTLLKNVDLTDANWTPIGTASNPFSGVFDGNNKTIDGLTVNITELGGLFGYVNGEANSSYVKTSDVWDDNEKTLDESKLSEDKYSAVVKDLILSNVNVKCSTSGKKHMGALAAISNNAFISNIKVLSGNITGYKVVSGLLGAAYGSTVVDCIVGGDVTVTASNYHAGGIIGATNTASSPFSLAVIRCENNAKIVSHGNGSGFAGGIIGDANSGLRNALVVYDCVNNGVIEASGEHVAGIVGEVGLKTGEIQPIIANCINNGSITTVKGETLKYVGGICSNAAGLIHGCTNNGSISGSISLIAGGIIGSTYQTNVIVSQCANYGDLTGITGVTPNTIVSTVTHGLTLENQTYANVDELQTAISSVSGSVELKNLTVNDTTGTLLLPSTCKNLISDKQYFKGLDISNCSAEYITVTIPNSDFILHGDASSKTLGLSGKNNKTTFASDCKLDWLRNYGSNGTYVKESGCVVNTIHGATQVMD